MKEIKQGAVTESQCSWGLGLVFLSGQGSPWQGGAFQLRPDCFFKKRRKS